MVIIMWMLWASIAVLVIFYPIKVKIIYDKDILVSLILFNLIRIPLNYKRYINKFVTQKIDRSFDFSELIENTHKVLDSQEILFDIANHSSIEEFEWYTDIPLEFPLLGIYMYDGYHIFQSYIISWIETKFKSVNDLKVDSNMSYVRDDIKIYFSTIISTSPFWLLFIFIKYINKLPIIKKRVS